MRWLSYKHTSITAVFVLHLQTLSLWRKHNNNNVFIHIYLMAGICVSNESAAKNRKLLRNTKTYFSLHLPSSGGRSGSMWGCKEGCICFGENLERPQLKLWSLPQMNSAERREAHRLIVSHGSVFNWIQRERETGPLQ